MHVRCSVFCRLLSSAAFVLAASIAHSQTTASVVSSDAANPAPARQVQSSGQPAIPAALQPILHQYDVLLKTLATGARNHWSQEQLQLALKNALPAGRTICIFPVEMLLQPS